MRIGRPPKAIRRLLSCPLFASGMAEQNSWPLTELKDGKAEGLVVELFELRLCGCDTDLKFVPLQFEQVQRSLEDGHTDDVFRLGHHPKSPVFHTGAYSRRTSWIAQG